MQGSGTAVFHRQFFLGCWEGLFRLSSICYFFGFHTNMASYLGSMSSEPSFLKLFTWFSGHCYLLTVASRLCFPPAHMLRLWPWPLAQLESILAGPAGQDRTRPACGGGLQAGWRHLWGSPGLRAGVGLKAEQALWPVSLFRGWEACKGGDFVPEREWHPCRVITTCRMSLDREFACQANPGNRDSFYKIVVQTTNC